MKEVEDTEAQTITPLYFRSEKLVEMAQLQQEIDELETEQRKRKFPSETVRERIKFLINEMEDLETELEHVEEEIQNSQIPVLHATPIDVKLSDLVAVKKTTKKRSKKPLKKATSAKGNKKK